MPFTETNVTENGEEQLFTTAISAHGAVFYIRGTFDGGTVSLGYFVGEPGTQTFVPFTAPAGVTSDDQVHVVTGGNVPVGYRLTGAGSPSLSITAVNS